MKGQRHDREYAPRVFDYTSHLQTIRSEQMRTVKDENGEEVTPWNTVMVETAGFVPLEVRMKQMEQNGLFAQAVGGELSPDDLREAYFTSDFELSPDDELEEVLAKRAALNAYLDELKKKRAKEFEEMQSKNPAAFSKEEYSELREMILARRRRKETQNERVEEELADSGD